MITNVTESREKCENALLEKCLSYFVLLYNVFFAIVSKTFFYIKITWLYWNRFFFFTVYRVHSEVVDGNFSPIGEYSSTFKNWQKSASVHHCVGVKELNMKNMYMKNKKYETVHHVFFITKTDQFLIVNSLHC